MFIIITASPNIEGLTAACGKAAYKGVTSEGGKAEIIDISAENLEPCRICGDGWGQCFESKKCIIDDKFAEIQAKIREAEGVILITPVYFCQPSERMKYFLDRFRRCEAFIQNLKSGDAVSGKQIDLIAAAGGSGHGTIPCLAELEMWCRHVNAIPRERIGITNYNRSKMLSVIEDAAARFVKGDYFKGW